MQTNTLNIKVHRIYKLDGERSLKAFVDIAVNDALVIKGIKLIEGKNGLFISMPQEQAKDKKWYESVRCMNKEVKEMISNEIIHNFSANENFN